jgi:hypothetical protein
LLFLIDIWPVIRDPHGEAEREVGASFPRYPQMGHDYHIATVTRIESKLRRRRRYYGLGVLLLLVGFGLQIFGAIL